MYIPDHFKLGDKSEIISFIREYSFATIINVKDNFPSATHLPFIVKEENNELYLISHLAKANDQWKEIETNKTVVIFSEPHAYISPKNYDSEKNVPTWNYVSIHIYGDGKIITSDEETSEILKETILTYESDFLTQWDSLPDTFKNNLIKGIVAFKIKVTDIQAKKKASQNRSETEKKRIFDSLSKSTNELDRKMASFVKK
ncbi:MAG: FMN-binding negative transcriptional regulator [Limnohabitans sp.]|nr:FMN-binding negative transcriptional regulator [Limnohabitans sp.]